MFENLTRSFTGIFSGFGGRKLTEKNIGDAVREIQVALLEADVAFPVVKDFVKAVTEKALGEEVIKGVDSGQQFVKIVNDELIELMGAEETSIEWNRRGPTVILLAGLQGSGKTTTCGKLALYLRDRKERRPMMVAADLQRPAAVDQLKILGEQLDIPVFHQPGLTPPKLCAKAIKEAQKQGCDTVLLDTAGRLHIDEALMAELKQVAKKTTPDEILLVCDAMTGQDAVNSAREFNESLELSGVVLTKLDGDARGGAALSVKAVTGKPIKFIGVGEKLDKLEEFHPDRLASRILGMGDIVGLVDKAQQVIDEETQAEMEQKLLEGKWNLNDFLGQLQAMKKLGNLKDLLAHLPGMGAHTEELNLEGNEMQVPESIIQSMTPQERERPEILNTGRRSRIAKGAGRSMTQVNDFLKQFKQMKQMMDGIGGGKGMLGKFKAYRGLKKQLAGAESPEDMARSLTAGPGGTPMLPGMPPMPGMGGNDAKSAKRGTQKPPLSAKERRKKRKGQRQQRKKSRKR